MAFCRIVTDKVWDLLHLACYGLNCAPLVISKNWISRLWWFSIEFWCGFAFYCQRLQVWVSIMLDLLLTMGAMIHLPRGSICGSICIIDTDLTIRYLSRYLKNVLKNKQMNNTAYFNAHDNTVPLWRHVSLWKNWNKNMNLPFFIATQNTKLFVLEILRSLESFHSWHNVLHYINQMSFLQHNF
jgi:hypothetical protein